jgi:hypothetical protein
MQICTGQATGQLTQLCLPTGKHIKQVPWQHKLLANAHSHYPLTVRHEELQTMASCTSHRMKPGHLNQKHL